MNDNVNQSKTLNSLLIISNKLQDNEHHFDSKLHRLFWRTFNLMLNDVNYC